VHRANHRRHGHGRASLERRGLLEEGERAEGNRRGEPQHDVGPVTTRDVVSEQLVGEVNPGVGKPGPNHQRELGPRTKPAQGVREDGGDAHHQERRRHP
jgi:hypothetical protein